MLWHQGFPYLVRYDRAVDDLGNVSLFGGATTVTVFDPTDLDRKLARGVATCHPKLDRFNHRRGREIALGRAIKSLQTRPENPTDAVAVDWFNLSPRSLDRLMALAFREAAQDGFCYVHFHDAAPPKFILMTPERYQQLTARLFPGTIPEGDPEWSHSHATPEMAEDARGVPRKGLGP